MFERETRSKHECRPVGECTCGKGPYCFICGYCSDCGGARNKVAMEAAKTYCRKCGSLLRREKGRGRPKEYCNDCNPNQPGGTNV